MPDALDTLIFGDPHEVGPVFEPPTLETMLTSPEWFGLETATPMQRAVCRIADGLDVGHELAARCAEGPRMMHYQQDIRRRMSLQWALGAHDDDVPRTWQWSDGLEHGYPELPGERPVMFTLLAAIRTFKTLFGAANAACMALRCDASDLRPGEVPRVSVISLDLDKAAVLYGDHLLPAVERSPALRAMLVGEPKAGSATFRQPHTGREVEIKVVAGKRAGGATVSRWSAGAEFDEAARMVSAADGVVNLGDQRKVVLGRLLPGGQICQLSSPWAPIGEVYDDVQQYHGKPCAAHIVFRAAAPAFYPRYWTPERCETMRRHDSDAFQADVLGEFIAVLTSLFGHGEVERILRGAEDLPRNPRCHYSGIIDPATRSNAWVLVIAAEYPDAVRRIAAARQWLPEGGPLRPKAVWADIAEMCHKYGVTTVYSDQWAADHNRDMAADVGLGFADESATQLKNVDAFDSLRMRARGKTPTIQVPDVPFMADDLKRAQRKVTTTGVRIVLPVTKDGRHCDYASAVSKVAVLPMAPASPEPLRAPDGVDAASWEDERRTLEEHERRRRGGDDSVYQQEVRFS